MITAAILAQINLVDPLRGAELAAGGQLTLFRQNCTVPPAALAAAAAATPRIGATTVNGGPILPVPIPGAVAGAAPVPYSLLTWNTVDHAWCGHALAIPQNLKLAIRQTSGWWGAAPIRQGKGWSEADLAAVLVARIIPVGGLAAIPPGPCIYYLQHNVVPSWRYVGQTEQTLTKRMAQRITDLLDAGDKCGPIEIAMLLSTPAEWDIYILDPNPAPVTRKTSEAHFILAYNTLFPHGLNLKLELK